MEVRMLAGALAIAVAVLSVPAAAADGPSVWKAQCAKCHGETGAADTPAAKALKMSALAGNEKIASMSGPDLVAAIKANKKHAALKVADPDLEAAAEHAKELAGK